jgi:hypothetical protein
MSCGFLRRWRCVGGVRRFVEGAVVGMNGRGVWEVEEVVEVKEGGEEGWMFANG